MDWYKIITNTELSIEQRLMGIQSLLDIVNKNMSYIWDYPKCTEYFQATIESLIDALDVHDEQLIKDYSASIKHLINVWKYIYVVIGNGPIRDGLELYLKKNAYITVNYNAVSLDKIKDNYRFVICDKTVPNNSIDSEKILYLGQYIEDIFLRHSYYWLIKEKFYNNISNAKCCITGMSYYRDAIDDKYFDIPIASIANGSQDLYFDYLELEKAYKLNNNLEYVVMGLAPYSLRYDESKSKKQLAQGRIFPYIHEYNDDHNLGCITDYGQKIKNERSKIAVSIGLDVCHFIFNNFYHAYSEDCMYNNKIVFTEDKIHQCHIDEIKGSYQKPYDDTIVENKEILNKYVSFCTERNIKVLVCISPFSTWHNERWNKQYRDELIDTLSEMKKKYNFSILDVSLNPWPDYYFRDYSHLNRLGAIRFSRLINEYLKQM